MRSLEKALAERGGAQGGAEEALGGAEEDLGGAEEDLGDAEEALGGPEEDLGDAEEALGGAEVPERAPVEGTPCQAAAAVQLRTKLADMQQLLLELATEQTSVQRELDQAAAALRDLEEQRKAAAAAFAAAVDLKVNRSPAEVLQAMVDALFIPSIMLALEEQCVAVEAYTAFASAFNNACAQVVGTRPNDPDCPKLLASADAMQGIHNILHRNACSDLGMQRGGRNIGSLIDMYLGTKLVLRNTKSKSDTAVVKVHIDGNTNNGRKRLYGGLVNVTDNIPAWLLEGSQEEDGSLPPRLSRSQDPTSLDCFDLFCLTTDYGLGDKDMESIEVLRENLGVYAPQIKAFMQGILVTRPRLRSIAAEIARLTVPQQLHDRFGAADRVAELVDERKQLLAKAKAEKQMVELETVELGEDGKEVVTSSRWVFVWLEAVPDLKGLKAMLGLPGNATTNPCHMCDVTDEDLQCPHRCHAAASRHWHDGSAADPVVGALRSVWPDLPLAHWRCCVLHAECRVAERLTQRTRLLVYNAWKQARAASNPQHAVTAHNVKGAFCAVLIKCGMHAGSVAFKEVEVQKVWQLDNISMNGQDARNVRAHWRELMGAVSGLSDMYRGDDLDLFNARVAALNNAWAAWEAACKYFSMQVMSLSDYVGAVAALRGFVAAYRAIPADKASRISHYLHLMEVHTEWFLGYDGATGKASPLTPYLASTQCMEHKHKYRNKHLRSCTMHGKSIRLQGVDSDGVEVEYDITSAPEIWQYLLKEYRLFRWRELVAQRRPAGGKYVVCVSELECLMRLPGRTVYSEADIRSALGLLYELPVHLVGFGLNTCRNRTITVTSATRAARDKLVAASNTLLVTDKIVNHGNKRPAPDAEDGPSVEAQRKKARREAGAKRVMAAAGLQLTPREALGPWQYQAETPAAEKAAREAAAALPKASKPGRRVVKQTLLAVAPISRAQANSQLQAAASQGTAAFTAAARRLGVAVPGTGAAAARPHSSTAAAMRGTGRSRRHDQPR